MEKKYDVLIVGGGNAGLSAAAQLVRKRSSLRIGLIEPSDKHYYQPAWTLVGAGEFAIQDTVKSEKNFIPAGVDWIRDAVATFQPQEKTVTTKAGQVYGYRTLIVAPGIQLDWGKIDGLLATLGEHQVTSNYSFEHAPFTWEMIRNMTSGRAVFTNPSSPIKCGGAPHKIMYLACDYWKKKGVLDQIEVHYLSGAGGIFAVPEYAATLKKVVADYGIHTHFLTNTVAVDGPSQTVFFESKNEIGDLKKDSLTFDFLHAVPPQSAPQFIKESPLADEKNMYGYVEIDKHTLQHVRFPEIFACGDCTNAPCSKTGAAIRKQVPVVVENLLAVLDGKTLSASYTGYSACPIPTQYGKLMLAEFDYSNTPTMTFPIDQTKPRRTMWFMKKYVLPWLYWNKILKGTA